MDNIISTPSPSPKVTTGPLPSSQKVYVTPDAAPDLSVPLREIELSSPIEPRVRVYDTTGPYTDSSVVIDVNKGLARTRRAWSWLKTSASKLMNRAGRSAYSSSSAPLAILPPAERT